MLRLLTAVVLLAHANGEDYPECEGLSGGSPIDPDDMASGCIDVLMQNKKVAAIVSGKKQCQADCLETTIPAALRSIIDRNGWKKLVTKKNQMDIGVPALTGAFRACYPGEPRDDVVEIMKSIFDPKVQASKKEDRLKTPKDLEKCEGTEPTKDQIEQLGTAFRDIWQSQVTDNEGIAKIEEQMMKCQDDCLENNFKESATLGELLKCEDKEVAKDSMTGAFVACLPGQDRDVVKAFVGSAVDTLWSDARLRLYSQGKLGNLGDGGISTNMILGASAALLFVGAVAFRIRRMHQGRAARSQHGLIAADDDSEGEGLE